MNLQPLTHHSPLRPRINGKFLTVDGARFLIKGVAYGTFAPDVTGRQFPAAPVVARDFAAMAAAGINTIRTYTAPDEAILDEAARHGLRVMIGVPWTQHVAFLDDRALTRQIRHELASTIRGLASHPAALLFAIGNEIPPAVVRWLGQRRVERFLAELAGEIKGFSPESLLTYVNFPPTEYLGVDTFDVCAFNVYLHREPDLRAYLARLQHIAGNRPLLLAECGADSIREGLDGQAHITGMQLRAAFEEGACGAVAFSWTDEWWRGGHPVTDWAFGLVDAERQPKPALAMVRDVYADAPFARDEQLAWPKVSVVVCAYNAADTIDDCLRSLDALTYPNAEVIVVNDGSRDATADRVRAYPRVRLVEVPNGGLSAARNIGLAHATGDIVAYTDADVRVDPDWLTYLVQPLLREDVVGAGGPNVVPADDPWVAQSVARAPGGPTHVMLDDRIAEHVPGCNMAFRREALLAVGGFNPVYLRAGDDVDICWRLQARGLRIGFAPSALVWHHHRASISAYWKQQVGYGEGETWLDAHHPEKFVGGQMLWRGRIYSPLPFVRSLSGHRINSGVWGTAAFPSVYRTDVHPAQFLPHSLGWMLISTVIALAGLLVGVFAESLLGLAIAMLGVLAWSVTLGRCVAFARRSDIGALGRLRWLDRARMRGTIAWLHLIQPVARAYGRLRGMWSPPSSIAPEHVTGMPWKVPVPSLRDVARSALLLIGGGSERAFWSDSWIGHTRMLTDLTGRLRASRPAPRIDVDDGWHADRDVSVGIGRWGWLHSRVLVEEHAEGRCLVRVAARLRPGFAGAVQSLLLAAAVVGVTSAGIVLRWPVISFICVAAFGLILVRAAWQTTRVVATFDRALTRVVVADGMIPLAPPGAGRGSRVTLRPATTSQIVQSVIVLLLALSASISTISVIRGAEAREALATVQRVAAAVAPERPVVKGGIAMTVGGDLLVADAAQGTIRRIRVRQSQRLRATTEPAAPMQQAVGVPVPFDAAADIALTSNGDLFVADPANHRICRIDRPSGKVTTVAGTGGEGYDSAEIQAAQSPLRRPEGIAVDRLGDLYIADTMNHRIRHVSQATGLIRTIAGDGEPGGLSVGDNGPALEAHLNAPAGVAVAANGDVYIADTGHNRIRKVEALTGRITTRASIPAPTGLALIPVGPQLFIYVIDSRNGVIRIVDPNGGISTLAQSRRLVAPTRLAYSASGWLYVKDGSAAGVTAIPVPNPSQVELAAVRRHAGARKPA